MNLVVQPFVDNQNSELVFHQFVEGLVHSTTANNVMSLTGDRSFLFANDGPTSLYGSQLYIRPVYAPLTALIDQGMQDSSLVMITGTPGVGKTMMRNWYLKHLISKPFGPDELVRNVFLHGSSTSNYHMIKMERIATVAAVDGIPIVQVRVTASVGENIVSDKNRVTPVGMTYSLVDVDPGGNCTFVKTPSRPEDRLVLFTSPTNQPKEKFDKMFLVTYYMPLWTLAELQDARVALALDIPEAEIIDRFKKIGGMARYVFSPSQAKFDNYVNVKLHEKASTLNLSATSELVSTINFIGSTTFLHSLAYFFVRFTGPDQADYDFRSLEINWGTKFIITEVIGVRWSAVLANKMRRVKFLNLNGLDNPAIVGYMFEGWAIQKLHLAGLTGMHWTADSNERQWDKIFKNGDSFKREFPIEYVLPESMPDRLRAAAPGTLIVPTTFNYPVIDCVMKGGTMDAPLYACIQVTVAHTHAMSEASELLFMNLMGEIFNVGRQSVRRARMRDRTAIFYLVPPSQFDSFRLPVVQTYPGRLLKLTLNP